MHRCSSHRLLLQAENSRYIVHVCACVCVCVHACVSVCVCVYLYVFKVMALILIYVYDPYPTVLLKRFNLFIALLKGGTVCTKC